MTSLKTRAIRLAALMAGVLPAFAAHADQPVAKQLGFQAPATEIMERTVALHNGLLMPIIVAISLFVLALMLYVMVRFSARANPEPSKTSHNTLIEVIWTVVPVLILVAILVPSVKLLYFQETVPAPDVVVKITGNQWNWTYAYPDLGEFEFTAIALKDDEASAKGLPRLLATDQELVIPAGKNVKLLVTASDVIHSWTVPAFGVKTDAVPGRINESWFNVKKPGLYYGQCSELCGKDHGFMPIMVRVVAPAEFEAWVAKAKEQYAQGQPVTYAALDAPVGQP